jgi:hypothetical protein
MSGNSKTDDGDGKATRMSSQMQAVVRLLSGQEERTIAQKLADSNRPTWEQYKKDNEDKLNLEGMDQKKMEEYRAQLDKERETRLARGTNHKQDKKKKSKKKKKRSRRRDDSSSDSSDSEDSHRRHKKHKKKRKRKHRRHRDGSGSSSDSESIDDGSETAKRRKHKRKKRRKRESKDEDDDDDDSDGSHYRLSKFFDDDNKEGNA